MEEIRNVCRIYSENLERHFGNIGVDARFLLKPFKDEWWL
jgi:hypothetical protein